MVAKLKLFDVTKKHFLVEEQKIQELIKRRRLQLLVHSCIYYRLNKNIISDYTFDEWARELCDLQTKYPNLSKTVIYYDDFKDFDGSSGFDLPYGDPCILNRALKLLAYVEEK